jgi:hypothetical protein
MTICTIVVHKAAVCRLSAAGEQGLTCGFTEFGRFLGGP